MTKLASSEQLRAHSPVTASVLSLIVPGLGHIYLGCTVTGLSLMVAHVSLGSLATLAVAGGVPSLSSVVLVASPWCALWLVGTFWAYHTARAKLSAPVPRPQHPAYLYLLLGLLALPNAVGWALAIRANVAEVFRVPSRSMLPNIQPGSRVLLNKLVYRKHGLVRGDLVVFTNPNARHAKYIKRVVALPGDTVEMRDDELIVNGQRLDYLNAEPSTPQDQERIESNGSARYRIALGPTDQHKPVPSSFQPLRIPNGQCFVLGDNRHQSEDSRTHGPVPLADVIGRVEWIF